MSPGELFQAIMCVFTWLGNKLSISQDRKMPPFFFLFFSQAGLELMMIETPPPFCQVSMLLGVPPLMPRQISPRRAFFEKKKAFQVFSHGIVRAEYFVCKKMPHFQESFEKAQARFRSPSQFCLHHSLFINPPHPLH